MKTKLLVLALATIATNAHGEVNGSPLSQTKTWTWSPTEINGGAVWGNAGYMAGEQTDATHISGAWWGCGTIDGEARDNFASQLIHTGQDTIPSDAYSGAYMVMSSDGTLSKYDNAGNLINVGSYGIEEWAEGTIINGTSARGYLSTTPGAILWPYNINSQGNKPTRFEITYLNAESLILVYADPGTSSWSESTWWSFKSTDGVDIAVEEWNSTVEIDGIYYEYDSEQGGAVVKNSVPNLEVAYIKPEVEINGEVYPVVHINKYAFIDREKLKEVYIPEGVRSLGDASIAQCANLEKVELPSTLVEIGKSAFAWCSKLTDMSLPTSVEVIGDEALCGCHQLKIEALPESLTTLGKLSLEQCQITRLIIPDKLTIEPQAFLFSPLNEFVISDTNPRYKAIDGNIYTKEGDTLVRMTLVRSEGTPLSISETCVKLGDYCMYGCNLGTTPLRLSEHITEIGDGAFINSIGTEVTLGDNVKRIGNEIFKWSYIETVTFPTNMPEHIGVFLLERSMVKHIIIPDGWTSIPNQFACDAYKLESITYGDHVVSFGENAFVGFPVLKEFILKPSIKDAGTNFLCYTAVEGSYNVPEGLEYFGKDSNVSIAFGMVPRITEITIPSTLKKPVGILAYMAQIFMGWEFIYQLSYLDDYGEKPYAIRKVVNLSKVPIGIENYINLCIDELPDNQPGNTYINYYCLPGIGRYTNLWDNPENTRTMDGCIEILSFDDVSINEGICTFTVSPASEEFEISKVTYEGNIIEPVSQSRASGAMTYSIEGIGSNDLCKVEVEFKYAEYQIEAPIELSSDGSATTSISDAFVPTTPTINVTSDNGCLYAQGATPGQEVRVYDYTGRQVSYFLATGNDKQMIAFGLMPGIYMVKAGTTTAKVLVR